jgi:ribonuclease HI
VHNVTIYTDGGARSNPGPAGAGAVAYQGDEKLFELKKYLGERTNNWAEYEALILALTEATKRGLVGRELEIRMDSELIVRQMTGQYKVKDKNLKVQHANVRALLADFPGTRFVHVPREENKEADRLVNEAIDDNLTSH